MSNANGKICIVSTDTDIIDIVLYNIHILISLVDR